VADGRSDTVVPLRSAHESEAILTMKEFYEKDHLIITTMLYEVEILLGKRFGVDVRR
jgi:hypothetical protein